MSPGAWCGRGAVLRASYTGASPPVQIIDAPPSATLPAISATYFYRWPDVRSGSAVELKGGYVCVGGRQLFRNLHDFAERYVNTA